MRIWSRIATGAVTRDGWRGAIADHWLEAPDPIAQVLLATDPATFQEAPPEPPVPPEAESLPAPAEAQERTADPARDADIESASRSGRHNRKGDNG